MIRYSHTRLQALLSARFVEAGVSNDVAETTARVLVEGDLLGHHTHGVKLANGYLKDLSTGHAGGNPSRLTIERSSPVAALYDGHYLLGPYLVNHALEACAGVAREFGVGMVSLRRSHHIACLAAYLLPLVERGLIPIIMSSDPAVASVAPYGGTRPVYTPNPIAIGIPGREQPMLIDVSMSTVTNGTVNKAHASGIRLAHSVILDGYGAPSDDPAAFFGDPLGSILPLGGQAFGHKGFALGLMVETLTAALSGFGRKDAPQGWGAAVMVMVIDPVCFGGREAFLDETDYLARRCWESGEVEAGQHVRLPGQAGLTRRDVFLREGIPLPADVVTELEKALGDSAMAAEMAAL